MGPEAGLPWAEAQGLAAVYLVPDGERLHVMTTRAFQPLIVDAHHDK